MAMKRCNNGHFYDSSRYSICPFCGVQSIDVSATVPARNIPQPSGMNVNGGNGQRTVASGGQGSGAAGGQRIEKTEALGRSAADGKTVGIMRSTMGFEPVVGWLVCVKGPEKGKDYRLKSEKNFIGRGNNMDVCIRSDSGISRDTHAVVSYNPKNNSFKLYPGDGRGLLYLNGDEVAMPTDLHKGDYIELGETVLAFVPFCGEDFVWQKD